MPALGNSPAATETASISSQLIPLDALPAGAAASQATTRKQGGPSFFASLVQSLADRWGAIPAVHQKRILIVGIGTAAVALLVAFGFARQTTWVTTALLGSLMLMAGVHALVHVYGPQYEFWGFSRAGFRYLMLGVLTVAGMGVQRRFFWPSHLRRRVVPSPPPPPAA